MSRIICLPSRKVKPTRHSPRPAAPFGAGILAYRPTFKAPYTASDAAWWAEQQATADDRWIDQLYAESVAQDRLESGTLL